MPKSFRDFNQSSPDANKELHRRASNGDCPSAQHIGLSYDNPLMVAGTRSPWKPSTSFRSSGSLRSYPTGGKARLIEKPNAEEKPPNLISQNNRSCGISTTSSVTGTLSEPTSSTYSESVPSNANNVIACAEDRLSELQNLLVEAYSAHTKTLKELEEEKRYCLLTCFLCTNAWSWRSFHLN